MPEAKEPQDAGDRIMAAANALKGVSPRELSDRLTSLLRELKKRREEERKSLFDRYWIDLGGES